MHLLFLRDKILVTVLKGQKIVLIKYSSNIHISVYIRSDKLESYQLVFGSQRGKM